MPKVQGVVHIIQQVRTIDIVSAFSDIFCHCLLSITVRHHVCLVSLSIPKQFAGKDVVVEVLKLDLKLETSFKSDIPSGIMQLLKSF